MSQVFDIKNATHYPSQESIVNFAVENKGKYILPVFIRYTSQVRLVFVATDDVPNLYLNGSELYVSNIPHNLLRQTEIVENGRVTSSLHASVTSFEVGEYIGLYVNKILLLSSDGKARKIKVGESLNLIPTMTTDTVPLGIASASTIYTGFNAYKAFDKDKNDGAKAWSTNAVATGWLQYKFATSTLINKFKITGHIDDASRSPKNWTIVGSNTGLFTGEQIILDTRVNINDWKKGETKDFIFTNNVPYLYYRINITANNGHVSYLGIQELEMIEVFPSNITSLPSKLEHVFTNHGMSQSDLASVDPMKDFTEKHYIQDVSTVLGSGKVFEQTLDMNKLIKKIKIK